MRLNWKNLLSNKRVSEFDSCSSSEQLKNSKYDEPRSPFEKDFDQIIFSYSFRRLQDKTQVIPFPKFDFVHTRLTHSLEVASIGRSFGKLVFEKINNELGSDYTSNKELCKSDIGALIAAACLAHDIGNPPFGHSGEKAISYYFLHEEKNSLKPDNIFDTHDSIDKESKNYSKRIKNTKRWNDLINFEGNANGFRILTHNCEKGINPTAAFLGVFSKYPRESWLSTELNNSPKELPISQQKYGFFYEQRELFNEVAENLGLKEYELVGDEDISFYRHPLAFLMEAADDIAYRMIDFEDGLRLNLIDYSKKYSLYKNEKDKKEEKHSKRKKISPKDILKNIANLDDKFELNQRRTEKEQIVHLRGCVINTLIHEVYKVFESNYEEIMKCKFHSSLIDKIENKTISENLFMMRSLIENYVYNYAPVLENEAAGFDVLGNLINDFAVTTNLCISCGDEETAKQRKIRSLIPDEYQPSKEKIEGTVDFKQRYSRLLKILDFISGMTDSYAISKHKRIHGIEISK